MGLTITEGAPTTTRVFHSGRGGAGNYHSVPKNPPPPPTYIPASTQPTNFYAGRGGAGNARRATERSVFSFDEELERDRVFHQHHAPVYSVGRGGAGNMVPADAISTRSHYSGRSDATPRSSTSTDRTGSSSVRSGNHNGLADRVLRTISRVRSSGSN